MPVVIVAWVSIAQSRQLGTHKHFYAYSHGALNGYFCITRILLACVKAGTVGFLVTVLLYYKGTIYIYISRHTVVCRAAQEAAVPPMSILTGRKKMQFSHLCSSVIPYPIGTKFAREVPASKGSLHTKCEEHHSSHFRDTSEQNFVLISSFFSSSTSLFRHFTKSAIKHECVLGSG